MTSQNFEKQIRKLHRSELAQSPELRREFKKKRKTESVAHSRFARNLFMPVFWCAIFFAMVQRKADLAWAAGIVALWSAGTALKWAHQWFHQFYAPTREPVKANPCEPTASRMIAVIRNNPARVPSGSICR